MSSFSCRNYFTSALFTALTAVNDGVDGVEDDQDEDDKGVGSQLMRCLPGEEYADVEIPAAAARDDDDDDQNDDW